MILDSSLKFFGDSISDNISASSTKNIDYKLDNSYALYGAELIQNGANFGDYISFQVIDKDNVLGFGANVILNQWVNKWYIDPNTTRWMVKSDLAATIPSGTYIRLIYTNTNESNEVKVSINFFFVST